jgi:hypothetical protein
MHAQSARMVSLPIGLTHQASRPGLPMAACATRLRWVREVANLANVKLRFAPGTGYAYANAG